MSIKEAKPDARVETDLSSGRSWVVYGEAKLNQPGKLLDDLQREEELRASGIRFNDKKQQFEYEIGK